MSTKKLRPSTGAAKRAIDPDPLTGVETLTIDQWLYQTLHDDATLMALITGVVADVDVKGLAYPFLVYSLQDSTDVTTANGLRIMVRASYEVRVVTDAESFGAIKAAVSRADALLHRASGAVTGGLIISCVREAPVRYTELKDGKLYRHLGGLYQIQAQ